MFMTKNYKCINYKCISCGKEYHYNKTICSCNGKLIPITEEKTEIKTEEIIIDVDDKKTYEQLEKDINTEIQKENQAEPFKKLSSKEFIDAFRILPEFVNGILREVPNDSEYYELAQIWIFTEKEIYDIFILIFDILDLYFPSVFKYLDKATIISIIMLSLTVIWIFVKKGIATYKFFKKKGEKVQIEQKNIDGEKEIVEVPKSKIKKVK